MEDDYRSNKTSTFLKWIKNYYDDEKDSIL